MSMCTFYGGGGGGDFPDKTKLCKAVNIMVDLHNGAGNNLNTDQLTKIYRTGFSESPVIISLSLYVFTIISSINVLSPCVFNSCILVTVITVKA